MLFPFLLCSLLLASAESASLRSTHSIATASFASLADRVHNTQFEKYIKEGTPAEVIHLKVQTLLDTLNKRYDSVSLTCAADLIAVRKSAHVEEALQALDAAEQKAMFASDCMKKNNQTVHDTNVRVTKLLSEMVLPSVYASLAGKEANITQKLKALADKHEVREAKFRTEQQTHTDSHDAVDSVLNILQSFYSTKGQAPPSVVKGAVVDVELKVPASLLELVHQGQKVQSVAAVSRMLGDSKTKTYDYDKMKNMVDTKNPSEILSDQPKKRKVAGTLWKAMWMLKNSMLNDTAIMHQRHQLRNDHSKSKIDGFTDELEDVEAQIKVSREQDVALQKRVNESLAEAKQAEIKILQCKEQLGVASVAQTNAAAVANRKRARIGKMEHLCEAQKTSIQDEIHLGEYVIKVVKSTSAQLHGVPTATGGAGATGSAAATGGADATGSASTGGAQ